MNDQRVEGLDAWRAILMILGVLLHANDLMQPEPPIAEFGFVSAHFRMGVFMTISGFVSGLTLRQRDVAIWLPRRFRQLAAPALTGWLLTIGAFALLDVVWHVRPRTEVAELHHIWFLVGLLLYLPIVLVFEALNRSFAIVRYLDRVRRGTMREGFRLVAGTVVASAVLMVMVEYAARPWGPVPHLDLIAGYAPMFMMGLILGRADDFRRRVLADWRPAAICLALVVAVEIGVVKRLTLDPADDRVAVVVFAGMVACPALASLLVLRSGFAIRRVGTIVRRISDASLTIYLIHYPILAVLGFSLFPDASPFVRYCSCILLAGLLSFAFHRFVVRSSALLSFLFDGAPLRRTKRREPRAVPV